MKIEFTDILIENFKNIDKLDVKFGNKTFVYGANETGKTTFADAISWCLTGKNSLGDSQFNFVPIGQNAVSPSVTLKLNISEKKKDIVEHIILQRVYQAKQNRSKEFTGEYQTVCYVNRLKVGVREFDKWIEDHICDPEIFRLIHDVRYFTENISPNGRERTWESQRRLLFYISNIKPDFEFARSKKRFEALLNGLQQYENANQYFSFLKSEEKRIDEEIRYNNAQIITMESMISDDNEDEDDLENRIKRLRLEKQNLETVIDQAKKSQEKENKSKLKELQNQFDKITSEFRKSQGEHSKKLDELSRKKSELQEEKTNAHCSLVSAQFDLKKAKESYGNINIQCPTCGQYMSAEMIEKRTREIEEQISFLQVSIDNISKREEEIRKDLENCEKELSGLKAPTFPQELSELQKEMNSLNFTVGVDKYLKVQLDEIEKELKELIFEKNCRDKDTSTKNKINEIENRKRDLLDDKANNSCLMDLCKDFIDAKCRYAEKKVNELFDGIEFKLFRQNKTNAEIKDCCDIFWNDTPYESLSYSTKFVVSMKIALAFQKFYKVEIPLVVDNAESIDFGFDIPVQTILLVKREEYCKCGYIGGTERKEKDGLWTCKQCGNRFEKKLAIVTE